MTARSSGLFPGEAERELPGDDLLPDATIVMDRATTLPARPDVVWPWLVQIGKDRAGWYLPRAFEQLLPKRRRAARHLDPASQHLAIGDRVADWGPGDPTLDTVMVDPVRTLGFRTVRGKTRATWVLHLEPVGDTACRLHARLRLQRPRDWATPLVAHLGGGFDRLTIEGLFAGLRERLIASATVTGDRQT